MPSQPFPPAIRSWGRWWLQSRGVFGPLGLEGDNPLGLVEPVDDGAAGSHALVLFAPELALGDFPAYVHTPQGFLLLQRLNPLLVGHLRLTLGAELGLLLLDDGLNIRHLESDTIALGLSKTFNDSLTQLAHFFASMAV